MSVLHPSDSHVQLEAEAIIRAGVEKALGTPLSRTSLHLPKGARVEVDGVDENQTIFVEMYAKQGPLRGAQFHKVARDALKLITVARDRDEARRILAFGDREAAACVTGESWLAEALAIWNVEVMVVDLKATTRAGVIAAQARQTMVNANR